MFSERNEPTKANENGESKQAEAYFESSSVLCGTAFDIFSLVQLGKKDGNREVKCIFEERREIRATTVVP